MPISILLGRVPLSELGSNGAMEVVQGISWAPQAQWFPICRHTPVCPRSTQLSPFFSYSQRIRHFGKALFWGIHLTGVN